MGVRSKVAEIDRTVFQLVRSPKVNFEKPIGPLEDKEFGWDEVDMTVDEESQASIERSISRIRLSWYRIAEEEIEHVYMVKAEEVRGNRGEPANIAEATAQCRKPAPCPREGRDAETWRYMAVDIKEMSYAIKKVRSIILEPSQNKAALKLIGRIKTVASKWLKKSWGKVKCRGMVRLEAAVAGDSQGKWRSEYHCQTG